MKKKLTTRVTIFIILLIVVVVGYYAYLSGKSKTKQDEARMTVVQETLSRDLERDYPATPKEVMKYYNAILRCFYNEECTEEQIEDLGNKARELYDAELLEQNELGTYFINLKADIQDYKDNERSITSFSVAASTSVDFFEEDGHSFARIMCGYNIMEKGENHSSPQVYLLRCDENKRWKIYGWKAVEELEQETAQE